jgi:hypothetical protein
MITLGRIVHYVQKTDYGDYILPALVKAQRNDDSYVLHVFIDAKGGSELIVDSRYSERKEAGTFHFRKGA